MIARMKKVWLVLLEKEKAGALRELRDLGVVHVECVRPSGGRFERLARTRDEVAAALNIIPAEKRLAPGRLSIDEALALARRILAGEDPLYRLVVSRSDRILPAADLGQCELLAQVKMGSHRNMLLIRARRPGPPER